MNQKTYTTELGKLTIRGNEEAITEISLNETNPGKDNENSVIKQAYQEISEYLDGKRTQFTVKLNPKGTEYQTKAWQALLDIPFGQTKTYKEVAIATGNEKASRAIGMACNRNPIMIMIPCHRVLGSNGSMTGYAGGISIKETLLRLEKTI